MDSRNVRRILKKYLLGNASPDEINTVDNWYQSFESEAPARLSAAEANAIKNEIWQKIAPELTETPTVRLIPRYLKVAAMVAVVAGAGLVFFLLNRKDTTTNNQASLAYTTIATKNGERKTVTINDGTTITLNAGTTIRVQDDFSTSRKVSIEDGEAYFDVKKDADRPFTIQSGGLTTTVLGTAFNISAYKGLAKISIGVVDGKISIADSAATLSILEKQQELVYNKTSGTYKKEVIDESMLAWKNGKFVLNDVSFDEMVLMMKKNFGVDIVTSEGFIKNTKYTTELFTSMQPAQAVEVLAAIHNLKIKVKENQIVLYK